MASPQSPAIGLLTLPPLTDPDGVQEVFSNDVVIQVRNGAVQLIFSSIQAVEADQGGKTTDRRIIRSRVALAMPVANALVAACERVMTAMHQHEAIATLVPSKPN